MPISAKRAQAVADAAVAWAKKVNSSSARAKDVDRALLLAKKNYDSSEYLARIAVSDMAREILRAVARAHRTGETSKRWASPDEMDKLSARGLGRYDKRKLYQASFRKAQSQGEWEYAQSATNISHIEYRSQRDARVRPSHSARDGVVRPKGDKWFRKNTPPLDPNCRCFLRAVSKSEFTKRVKAGENLPTPLPELKTVRHKNKVTGEVLELPEGVAPGFDIDPGSADAIEQYRKLLERRVAALLAEGEKGGA